MNEGKKSAVKDEFFNARSASLEDAKKWLRARTAKRSKNALTTTWAGRTPRVVSRMLLVT